MSARWQSGSGRAPAGCLPSACWSHRPIGVASGAVDNVVEPPRSALVVSTVAPSRLKWFRAASCRLRPSFTVPVLGGFPLVLEERRVRSMLHVDLGRRGGWRLVATFANGSSYARSRGRVKSRLSGHAFPVVTPSRFAGGERVAARRLAKASDFDVGACVVAGVNGRAGRAGPCGRPATMPSSSAWRATPVHRS